MWRFLKKAFAVITAFFNPSYVNSLECISMNNKECKARPKIIDLNNNEAVFYHYSIKVNKAAEIVAVLLIHILNYVFQIFLKT